MGEWRVERRERVNVREGFDCGKPSLNDFLHALVSQYEKRNLGRTYVALREGDPHVLGYYTLASVQSTPNGCPRNRPRSFPGMLSRSFCSHGWPWIRTSTEKVWAGFCSTTP